MTSILPFIGGIGIGAILSALIHIWYSHKEKLFEAKLSAYSTLINAYQKCAALDTDETRQAYVAAQLNIELLGRVLIYFSGCKKSVIGKKLLLFLLNSLLFASNKSNFFLDSLFFRFKKVNEDTP